MEMERAPYPEHPGRCQSVNSQGQCPLLGVLLPDETRAKWCKAHGGARVAQLAKKESLNNYRLTKWKARLDEKVEAAGIKSLREEIGILRVCLEERLNSCQDAHDLILQSGPIADMVSRIERVVTSCHKLEGSMGQLMDKQQLLSFAQIIIGIIATNLEGQEGLMSSIADQIITELGNMTGEE